MRPIALGVRGRKRIAQLKLAASNLCSSLKDRTGQSLVDDLEHRGERRPTWPVTLRLEPLPGEEVEQLIGQRVPAELRDCQSVRRKPAVRRRDARNS